MKKHGKTGLTLAVSGICLWWVFRDEDLGEIGRHIVEADPILLAAAGLIATAGGLIRAVRWKLLLAPTGMSTSLNSRWKALNIGFMVTNIALGRLGEIARPFALSRLTPVSMSAALGTVVLERVLDTIALLFLLILTLLAPTFPTGATVIGWPIGYAVMGVAVLAVAGIAVLGLFLFRPKAAVRVTESLAGRLPRRIGEGLRNAFEEFLSGLELLRAPGSLAVALLWSVFLWVWMSFSFWVGFQAFGIRAGFVAALFTQCVVSAFVAIPAGPGFIGTLQVGVTIGLHEVFGVAAGPTLSLAVGYHVAGYIPVTLLGLFYAWRLGLSLGTIRSKAEPAVGGVVS